MQKNLFGEIEKPKLCCSVSGGRTSWRMAKWCKDNLSEQYDIVYVFSNTGKEREETLVFNERCSKHFGINLIWIEAVINNQSGKGVRASVTNFDKACRNGEPFEALIIKFGLPNQNNSHCSRDLKGETIKAYCRSIGWKKHYTAIGIRYDEPARLNWKTAKKNRLIYPLATMVKCTKSDIAHFWSQQPFDLELKSYEGNCDLCWKKSFRKLMTIAIENPELADWWREMEQKYENHLGETRKLNKNIKLPMRFYRGRQTIDDVIEESKFPFDLATDESKDIDKDKLLSSWSEELDGNNGCVESCEAF